jgi:hypothetical protein
MSSPFYLHTTIWVNLVVIVMFLAFIQLLAKGKAASTMKIVYGTGFAAALLLFNVISQKQNLFAKDFSGFYFYLIILGGAGFVVLLFFLTTRNIFDEISQTDIQLVQGLRVFIGAGFLMEGVLQVIPGWFSILDGFFHITSGFLALAGTIAFQRSSDNTLLLWVANGVGLADIVVIVSGICFLVWENLGPYHNMNIVVFGVGPILLYLHFISIRKLTGTGN